MAGEKGSEIVGRIDIYDDCVQVFNKNASKLAQEADINNATFGKAHNNNAYESVAKAISDNKITIYGANFVSVNFHQREYDQNAKLDRATLINIAKIFNKKIVLVAKGASGKDHLSEELQKLGLEKEVSYTTRPAREGEVDGKDYHFVSEDKMIEMIQNGEIIQYSKFGNGYTYATGAEAFKKCGLMILTPKGLGKFTPFVRNQMMVVYIDISEEVRRERLNKRSDSHDTERRLKDDKEDFENFANWDIKINNPEF